MTNLQFLKLEESLLAISLGVDGEVELIEDPVEET